MLIKIEHECEDGLEFLLTFEYTPGYGPVMYLKNGDPGYPGQDEEVSFCSAQVVFDNGNHGPHMEMPTSWVRYVEDLYREEVCEQGREA